MQGLISNIIIPITAKTRKNKNFTTRLPYGSSALYRLLVNETSVEILPCEEFRGAINRYSVIVASDSDSGFVMGSGRFLRGSRVTVRALPLDKTSFVGWYVGDELVSTERIYTFRVMEDVELVAKFETRTKIHLWPSLLEEYTGNTLLDDRLDIIFSISYNGVIQAPVLIDGETMTVKFSALNNSREIKSLQFMLGLHDENNMLIDVRIQEIVIEANSNSELSLSIALPANLDGHSLRIMVWDNYTSVAPHTLMIVTKR